jgi:nucleobase transporter 1/2
MRATQGALIAGSAVNIVLGFSGLWSIATRFEPGAQLSTRSVYDFSSSSLKHFEAYSNLILLLLLLLRCRFISPVVIAPVTTIVGLGLLEYGFPGVCIYLRLFLFHYRPFLEVCSVAVGLGP